MEPREKILSAAAELFIRLGFKNVTMDDISHRAGISKKTLYQHFSNKPDIVEAAITGHQDESCRMCGEAEAESKNAVEAMVRIMAHFDQMHRQMNPMILFEMQRFYPKAYEQFREGLVKQDVQAVRANIERGVAEGLYREGLDADLLARYHIESALMVLQPNLMVNDRRTLQQVAHLIAEHFLYGLMTPKGEKLYQKYLKQSPK